MLAAPPPSRAARARLVPSRLQRGRAAEKPSRWTTSRPGTRRHGGLPPLRRRAPRRTTRDSGSLFKAPSPTRPWLGAYFMRDTKCHGPLASMNASATGPAGSTSLPSSPSTQCKRSWGSSWGSPPTSQPEAAGGGGGRVPSSNEHVERFRRPVATPPRPRRSCPFVRHHRRGVREPRRQRAFSRRARPAARRAPTPSRLTATWPLVACPLEPVILHATSVPQDNLEQPKNNQKNRDVFSRSDAVQRANPLVSAERGSGC